MSRKPSRKTLVRKLDAAWGALARSKGACEKCGRRGGKLDAAHIWGRQNRRLRWDPRNSMCLCFLCHREWHDYPLDAAKWIRWHRPADVEYLEAVQNEITHYSDADLLEILADLEGSLQRELAA